MTITRKLCIASMSTLAIVMVLGMASVISTRRMGAALDRTIHSTAAKAELAAEIRTSFKQLRIESAATQVTYVIQMLEADASAERRQTVDGVACSSCHSADAVAAHHDSFRQAAAAARERISTFSPLVEGDSERTAIHELSDALNNWSNLYEQYVTEAANRNFGKAHEILANQMYPLMERVKKTTLGLSSEQHRDLEGAAAATGAIMSQSFWVAVLSSSLGIFVAIAAVLLVLRVGVILRGVAARLGKSSRQVAAAASQVKSSSQALAQGACQQAAALEETASSMSLMSDTTHRSQADSRNASEVSSESGQVASRMEETVQAMSDSMRELQSSGDKIVEVVKLIDGIAFQTRILALNAAVEAARAGSSGAGFAVVADQVGNLAQQCTEAAKKTAGMVENTVQGVRDGATRLQGMATAIRQMADNARKVESLVAQVRTGNDDQSRGIDQVVGTIEQMNQMTQATAATAQESAAASTDLDSRAEQLCAAADQLRSLVGQEETAD